MSQIKIIASADQDWLEPASQLIKVSSRGLVGEDRANFVKRASAKLADSLDSLIAGQQSDEPLVHLLAIGGTESYGANRNGDGFTRTACKTYHPTFVKHAHFFRDHQNKDPKKSYGRVVTSWFNDPMDRIELIVGLNATEKRAEINGGLVADKEMTKLAADKNIAVSMACRVAYDVCSYCNNKAATKEAYCQGSKEGGMCKAGGLAEKLGQLVEIDGGIHHLHADNPHPRFFDISHVIRPADRIAYVSGLLKTAAAAAGVKTTPTRFAITVPAAAYTDLSDTDNQLLKAASDLATVQLADQSFIPALLPNQREVQLPGQVKMAEVWKALLDQQICLPLSQFLDVLGGHHKVAALVAPHVTDSFDELLCDPDITTTLQNSGYAPAAAAPTQLQKWASTLVADFSLQPTAIVRRSQLAAIQQLPLQSHALQKIASKDDNVAAKSLAAQYALYQVAYLGHLPTSESVLTASLLRLQNQVTPYYL